MAHILHHAIATTTTPTTVLANDARLTEYWQLRFVSVIESGRADFHRFSQSRLIGTEVRHLIGSEFMLLWEEAVLPFKRRDITEFVSNEKETNEWETAGSGVFSNKKRLRKLFARVCMREPTAVLRKVLT